MHIGQKIRELMRKKNFKQNHLAEKIGITTQRMGQILKEDDISINRLKQISQALDVPFIEFLDDFDLMEDSLINSEKVEMLRDQLRAKDETIQTQKELIAILRKNISAPGASDKKTDASL